MKIKEVFIGFDSREPEAYAVCKYSLGKLPIVKLEHRNLRKMGYFSRPWFIAGNGQYVDMIDGKPFSTEFSHSRFVTPILARDSGHKGWVLFCDSDFMFLESIEGLDPYLDDNKAVCVVKHRFLVEEGTKMDGMKQENYTRKLWSSLIAYNLSHPALIEFNIEDVNTKSGSWLHGFNWLLDHEIGEIPPEWNWIPGYSSPEITPKAVHFSFGIPTMEGYEDVSYANKWREFLAWSRL